MTHDKLSLWEQLLWVAVYIVALLMVSIGILFFSTLVWMSSFVWGFVFLLGLFTAILLYRLALVVGEVGKRL